MVPGQLTDRLTAAVSRLVDEAVEGRLAICIGAGISKAAGLPDGQMLADILHREYYGRIAEYQCSDPTDLVAVSSSIASLPGGLEALQFRIVSLAPFTRAQPTYGHKMLAILLAEGAFRLLTTNWDDCLERGWDEHISVAVDGIAEEQLRITHLVKIHGCCTRPETLLITEEQLLQPPFWTQGTLEIELRRSTMVFVGIGDVPDYAQKPITDLAQQVDGARVRVVSPGIVAKWDTSEWRDLLPNLRDERRIPMSADEFADQLGRGWVWLLLRRFESNDEPEWVVACRNAFKEFTALTALQWLRRTTMGWEVGESVTRSDEALAALKAIARLAKLRGDEELNGELPRIQFTSKAAVMVGEDRVEVLLALPHQTATMVARAARQRAQSVAAEFGITSVKVLCAAGFLEGPCPAEIDLPDIVGGVPDPQDLMTGPMQTPVRLFWAHELMGVA